MVSLSVVKKVLRHAWPFTLGAICCVILARQLNGLDLSALWSAVMGVSPLQWALALGATAVSFLAVSRYDVIALRHFQMMRASSEAMAVGATAIGLGQTLGAGAVVGAFVRWRMMPDLSLKDSARITAFVTVTFLAALAVTIAIAALILPTPHIPAALPYCTLTVALAVAVLAFVFPVLARQGRMLSFPTVSAMLSLLCLCVIDTFFAGLALYILLPPDVSVGFATLLPVFLIALGAAIFSGTPGGVGPFELTLLALLPHQPEPALLGAVLAFRAIYYAVPALLAGLVFMRHLLRPRPAPTPRHIRAFQPLEDAPLSPISRAELGVIRQNGGALLSCDAGRYGAVRTGQTLVALFDPIEGDANTLARPLRLAARAQNRIACKYKISARQAVRARAAGWAVMHISDEAILRPTEHNTQGSSYRQLRRKLRHAEKAQVQVSAAQSHLPLTDMARVSAAWEAQHGVPRGLTMGRFDDLYVGHQKVFLAYQDARLVGFVSFHATAHEWCLDLMRVLPDAPDGTMHLLVQNAIETAAQMDVDSLSLAAAPALPTGRSRLEHFLRSKHFQHGGGAGLRQFKACFAPRWQPLFMAAPGPMQLGIATIDMIRAVNLRSAPATPIACLPKNQALATAPSSVMKRAS
ncbi:phosphatidylglycerol lysyltransferase domain-containing protein [Shimia sp. MMG029]|uniref:phosphatidylglycerol lysyltransferase domain-containing protein n=1 Tax=Shimia sp. MMG029 TaxID=3021978 RepID=UPI0022FE13F6|nr:phosphatidylglycerol lysyltransferase domain-containing protein [Shimia sp. MMG029]MDA5555926.1 phosphatidylglycerol lysyltransferase domain-containing protein [Shimia sp. MMG029]